MRGLAQQEGHANRHAGGVRTSPRPGAVNASTATRPAEPGVDATHAQGATPAKWHAARSELNSQQATPREGAASLCRYPVLTRGTPGRTAATQPPRLDPRPDAPRNGRRRHRTAPSPRPHNTVTRTAPCDAPRNGRRRRGTDRPLHRWKAGPDPSSANACGLDWHASPSCWP
jgi:hypothetical protein